MWPFEGEFSLGIHKLVGFSRNDLDKKVIISVIIFFALLRYVFLLSTFALYSPRIWLTTSWESHFPSPFTNRRSVIRVSYSASLLVALNVRIIAYCIGYPVGGVNMR